jgi:hypothetical protein
MTLAYVLTHTLPAAAALLPPQMDTPAARVMLLAIGLQESRFEHRRQLGGGPARGFWQFEKGGGVAGVLAHPASRGRATAVCMALCYPDSVPVVYDALADNDVLAAAFARLLLWTLPAPLATTAGDGWRQYLEAWRPGMPRPATWAASYQTAAAAVFVA